MDFSDIPFQFIGNAVSLDLLNTEVSVNGTHVDLIGSRDRFGAWASEVPQAPALNMWSAEEIEMLYQLRDAFREILRALSDGISVDPAVMKTVNRHLEARCHSSKLVQTATGFRLETQSSAETPRAFLGRLAEDMAHVVAKGDTARIKTCANPECVLVFKDTSKSGRRRWCSMETCGNRSKAATFRSAAQK